MSEPKEISVIIELRGCADRKVVLEVEEFHPYEPAAYVWDAGWTCYHGVTEYFVSHGTGCVFKQPGNEEVGIAPEIVDAVEKLERQMEAWSE